MCVINSGVIDDDGDVVVFIVDIVIIIIIFNEILNWICIKKWVLF